MLFALVQLRLAAADLPTASIFTHGETNCTCIRIPTLVLSDNAVLLAFANCRPGTGDNCQPLRPAKAPAGASTTLVYKRSLDGGASWGALTVVPGSDQDRNGGPRAVALRGGSDVLLTNSRGKLWRSSDSGLSWSAPRQMFNASMQLAGGGVMLQLSANHPTAPGRLLAAWNGHDAKAPGCTQPYAAACEYASSYFSDDGGTSWTLSKSRIPEMDESVVLELTDGSGDVVMLSRNFAVGTCKGVDLARCATHQDGPCMCVSRTLSTDGGATWAAETEQLPSLFGANCHGAALTVNGTSYYAFPSYTGPARLPNPVHGECTWKGHCYTDRAPNRINGTVFKAAAGSKAAQWDVHERVTIGEAGGKHQTYAAFGYSSLSPLPSKLWPSAIGLMYETGAPDCGYDPKQNTATGMGSCTAACKIVFAVVDLKSDDEGVSAAAPQVWTASSLQRVMTQAAAPASTSAAAHIALAGNEFENFQVAVRSAAASNDTFAIKSTIKAPLTLRCDPMGYAYVSPTVLNSTDGWWPDAVLAGGHRGWAVAGKTTALWCTVHAPDNAKAGKYSGSVTLKGATGWTATVAVAATVFGFALPRRPVLQTAFNLDEEMLGKAYFCNGCSKNNLTDPEIYAEFTATGCNQTLQQLQQHNYTNMWRASADGGTSDMYEYCALTLNGRASPGQLAVCDAVPSCKCTKQTTPADNRTHGALLTWSHWLLTNFSLNPGSIYSKDMSFSVAELAAMKPLGLNSVTVMRAGCQNGKHGSAGVPFNRTKLLACAKTSADKLRTYYEQLLANGLCKPSEMSCTIYGYDESDMMEQMRAEFGYYKARFPKLKTFTTAHMCGSPVAGKWATPQVPCGCTQPCPVSPPPAPGTPVQDAARIKNLNVDLMCPILDWLKPANVSDCVEKGLDMWMYTSLEPWKPFLNFRVDNELWQSRLLLWQTAQLRMTGFLYWGLNFWKNPKAGDPKGATNKPLEVSKLSSPFIDPKDWDLVSLKPGSLDPDKMNVGDGQLTYAGLLPGGEVLPLASARLHAVRDGIEDYGYLALLRAKAGDAAVANATAGLIDATDLKKHMDGSASSLKQMMDRRTAIAQAISGHILK